jgi:hypothetical protein
MTTEPFEPHADEPDERIAAADPGLGAPDPAPGFGVGGEEPDPAEDTDERADVGDADDGDPPFRTPDGSSVRPEDLEH